MLPDVGCDQIHLLNEIIQQHLPQLEGGGNHYLDLLRSFIICSKTFCCFCDKISSAKYWLKYDWTSSTGTKVLERYRTIAKDTLKKDKRVNIRMTERDLKRFKIKALEEGIPYQTLISSILHKYIGRSFDWKSRTVGWRVNPQHGFNYIDMLKVGFQKTFFTAYFSLRYLLTNAWRFSSFNMASSSSRTWNLRHDFWVINATHFPLEKETQNFNHECKIEPLIYTNPH